MILDNGYVIGATGPVSNGSAQREGWALGVEMSERSNATHRELVCNNSAACRLDLLS